MPWPEPNVALLRRVGAERRASRSARDAPADSSRARVARGQARAGTVDRLGALPAFADRPDDERLAAACVAGGEYASARRRVGAALGVAARIASRRRALEQRLLGMQEAHREQDEVGRVRLLGAGRSSSNGGSPRVLRPWTCSTLPSPMSLVVEIAKSRSPPSLSA